VALVEAPLADRADHRDAIRGVLDAERVVVDVGLQGGKRRSGDNVLSLGCSKLFLFCGANTGMPSVVYSTPNV